MFNNGLASPRLLGVFFASALCGALLIFALPNYASQNSEQSPEQDQSPEQKVSTQAMTQERMASIIGELVGKYEGTPNQITFEINGAPLMLISNTQANRMRLLAPIISADDMTQEHLVASLISNYHLALDARYAVGNGILYSAYIHPLKELTRAQLESAIRQVVTLRATFGTGYTSGELTFSAQAQGESI